MNKKTFELLAALLVIIVLAILQEWYGLAAFLLTLVIFKLRRYRNNLLK